MAESDPPSSDSPRALGKEPSFSLWYGETTTPGPRPNPDVSSSSSSSSDDEDFELPLLSDPSSASHGRPSQAFDVSSPDQMTEVAPPISAAAVGRTLFLVLLWYAFSTCLTVYNKTLLGERLGRFPAPMLMNTIHFAMQAVFAKAVLALRGWRNAGGRVVVAICWRDYFFRVVPMALGSALDINLSNASLVFISVTFATMCKSAAPIFLLAFAFLFRLETPSINLFGIILIISIGILLTVAKEAEFELWGFILVMLAAVMSGFRWCMTQILLQKEAYGLKDPITLMSYVAPVMAMTTLVLSLIVDPWDKFDRNTYFNNWWHLVRTGLLMLLGGTLAFFMVLTEYVLVSATSAVTVTIAGVVKEAVTILVAVIYFHDQFTLLKGVGLLTIMIGVSLFNWYKYLKLKNSHLSNSGQTLSAPYKESEKYVILDEMDFKDDMA